MYKEVETMTAKEFIDWSDSLDLIQELDYNAFLFKHAAENKGEGIERVQSLRWLKLNVNNLSDLLNNYCRVKPEPKQLKYKPYEKADPKWLGKAIQHKGSSLIKCISAVDIENKLVGFSSVFDDLNYLFYKFEWYDLNTGETSPFGEAYYE